jgi:hypothetical protein
MIVAEFVLDFLAPVLAILAQLLAILDTVGTIGRDLAAFALPNSRHLASDFSTTAWRADAWAIFKEIADGAWPMGRQGTRSCPGARTADVEEFIELARVRPIARSPNTWLAARSNSRLCTP